MLEALPGSVVMATVLPIVVRDGAAAMLAIAAAGSVMPVTRKGFAGRHHRHGGRHSGARSGMVR
jgi:hypothetical protein